MSRVRRAARGAGRVLAGAVILGVGAVLVAAVIVPRFAGATPYVVLTGSMRPDLPPGTLVVVRPAPAEAIGVGDVITYQLESGEPTVVTHRVVGMGIDGRGERTFTTQGDANDTPDLAAVRPVQVRGEVWYAVPWVGHATRLVSPEHRALAVRVVVGGLLGYAAVMFLGARRGHPPSRPGQHAAARHASRPVTRPVTGPVSGGPA